jgi:hypothetical protein
MRRVRVTKDKLYSLEGKRGKASETLKRATGHLKSLEKQKGYQRKIGNSLQSSPDIKRAEATTTR